MGVRTGERGLENEEEEEESDEDDGDFHPLLCRLEGDHGCSSAYASSDDGDGGRGIFGHARDEGCVVGSELDEEQAEGKDHAVDDGEDDNDNDDDDDDDDDHGNDDDNDAGHDDDDDNGVSKEGESNIGKESKTSEEFQEESSSRSKPNERGTPTGTLVEKDSDAGCNGTFPFERELEIVGNGKQHISGVVSTAECDGSSTRNCVAGGNLETRSIHSSGGWREPSEFSSRAGDRYHSCQDITKDRQNKRLEADVSSDDGAAVDDGSPDSPIWKRTRAHLSLEGLSLDDLESFLQHSDEEDYFQKIDEEAEYAKFVAAVMAPQPLPVSPSAVEGEEDEALEKPSDAHADGNTKRHRNMDAAIMVSDIEDDEDDEDFLADHEFLALDDGLPLDNCWQNESNSLPLKLQKQQRGCKRIKRYSQASRKPDFLSKRTASLRPLVPYVNTLPRQIIHRSGAVVTPALSGFSSEVADSGLGPVPSVTSLAAQPALQTNPTPSGFSLSQIGQLYALFYEHVQLLIQIHALSALEPPRNSVSQSTHSLLLDLAKTWKAATPARTPGLPAACFSPLPLSNPLSAAVAPSAHLDLSSTLPAPQTGGAQTSYYQDNWTPPMNSSAARSVLDVPPLELLESYLADINSAIQRRGAEQSNSGISVLIPTSERVPLFHKGHSADVHACDTTRKRNAKSSVTLKQQRGKKSRLAGKEFPIALVPLPAASAASRFTQLFNPALFPTTPPQEGIVKRVLFTESEDWLLAMGVELFNNNWEAIHQRFLPAKTPHQISIRYKNCVSGRQPFNPIKAVRERKLSPLTVQEKLSINEALKVQRMDWNQVWQCCVPYRDPAQLPRLWRAACGLPLQSRTAANAQKHRLAKRRRAAQQLELSKLLGLGGEKTTSSFQNGMGVAIVESSEERTESDDDTDDDTNSFENEFIREAFLLKDASQPKNPLLQNVAASSEVSSHPSGTATKPRHENAQKSLAEQTSPAVLQEDVGTCTLAGRHATSVSSSSGVQAVASVLMQDINAVQGESVGTHISRINECQQFTENVPPRSAHQGGSGWKRRTRTSKVAVRNLPPIVLPNGKIICLGNQGTSSTMPQGAAITLKGQAPCNQVSRSRHDIVAGVTSGSMEGVRNGPRKNSRELDRSQRPRRGENGRYNNNASQRNAVETMGSGILAGTPNRAMQQTAVVSAGYVRNGGPAQHEINAEREADRLTSHAHIETVVEGGSVVEGRGRLSGAELEGMASDHPHPLLFGGEKRASRKKKNAVQARHQDAEKITVHSDIERNVVGNSEFGNIASGSILQERRGATSRLIAISEATALDSWLPNKSRGTNRAENDNNRRVFDFDLNEVDQGTRSIRAFDFDLNEGPGTEVGDGRLRTSQNLSVTMAGILQQNKKRRSGQQHSYPGGGFYAVGREIGAKTLPQGEPLVTSDKATMSPARVLEEAPHSGGGTGTDKDGTHCTDCHMIEFEREEMSDSETEQEQGR